MGLKTACIALLALLVPVSVAWSADIGGKYLVAGTNLDGSKYDGTADITISSDTDCHIVWHTGGQDLNGICMRGPESVIAGYVDQNGAGLVLYKIEADGTLRGVWTADKQKGVGTDVLTPTRLTSAQGTQSSTTPAGPPEGPSTKANDVPAPAATRTDAANKSGASPDSRATSEPSSQAMANPSFRACLHMPGRAAVETCTAAIDSEEFSGSDLALLYAYRGSAEAASDPKKAEQDYDKAIDLDSNLAIAFEGRGMLFYDRHDYDRALQDFNRSIALDATSAAAFDDRGITYFDMNDLDHAKADFDRAIELDAKDMNAYWNRGDLSRSKGDRDKAAADYRMALSLGPDDNDKKEIEASLNGLGSAAPAGSEHQGAAAPAGSQSNGRQAGPASDTANGKGASAETPTSGDGPSTVAPNASDSLKKKFETQLDGLGVKKNRAPDSAGPAAPDETISHGDGSASATNPDPDYQACRNDSGDEAIAACGQVIGSGKFGNPELALAYDRRGYMYWGKGDLRRAFDDTNKAIGLDPNFARAYSDRGMVYFTKRDYRHAIADFNRSIQIDPKFSLAYSNRGATYEQQKQYDLAVTDFDVAIALNPNLALAYYNRGTVYEAMGRRYNAILDYRRALERDPDDQDSKAALKKLGASAAENFR